MPTEIRPIDPVVFLDTFPIKKKTIENEAMSNKLLLSSPLESIRQNNIHILQLNKVLIGGDKQYTGHKRTIYAYVVILLLLAHQQ